MANLAQVLTVIGEISDTIQVANGLGRHAQFLNDAQLAQVLKWCCAFTLRLLAHFLTLTQGIRRLAYGFPLILLHSVVRNAFHPSAVASYEVLVTKDCRNGIRSELCHHSHSRCHIWRSMCAIFGHVFTQPPGQMRISFYSGRLTTSERQ